MQTAKITASIRYTALSLGLLFFLLGLAGFVPAFVAPANSFTYTPGSGYIFGIFPTNYFHNALGLLVGTLGIAAFTSLSGSIVFNRIVAVLYGASTLLGLLPFTNTLFGITPLFGSNVLLNAVTAAIAFYFGFIKAAEVEGFGTSAARPIV